MLEFLSRSWGYAILLIVTIVLFRDFIAYGYLMDGEYDARNSVMPHYLLFSSAMHSYQIPQWNPFLFCGNTIIGSAFLYPFNWIIWLSSHATIPAVNTAVAMVHFYFAGVFMWLLVREISGETFWSLIASICYLFSTSSIMHLFSSLVTYLHFVYGPLLFYLMLTQRKRGYLSGFLLQTVVFALLLLGGNPQFIVYLMGFIIAFIAFLFVTNEGGTFKRTSTYALISVSALAFAALLTAVRNMPFLMATTGNELVKTSYAEYLRIGKTNPIMLLRYFVPELFPTVNKGEYFNAYAGVSVAFLCLFAMVFLWDKKTLYWKLAVAGIVLTVVETPLTYAHFILTGKSNLAFGRMANFMPLCTTVLAAVAGKKVLEQEIQHRRFIRFSAIIAVMIFILSIQLYRSSNGMDSSSSQQMRDAIIHFALFSAGFLGLTALLYRFRMKAANPYLRGLLIFWIALDVLLIAHIDSNSQNPAFTQGPFFNNRPHEQAVARLFRERGRNFRVLGAGEGSSYNRIIHLDLYNSTGYDSVPPYYISKLYAYPLTLSRENARHIAPMKKRVFELTSTRYVLEDQAVYEIPASLPRYSLYYDYIRPKDDQEALELLVDDVERLDIHKTVVLDTQPVIQVTGPPAEGTITIVEERFNDVSFLVTTPKNAIFLLTDTYTEGWKAVLDGAATPVMRANYAFRAVAVPAGEHEVQFLFTERGFISGQWISLSALAVFIMLLVISLYLRKEA